MSVLQETVSNQTAPDLLMALSHIAESENRPLQIVLDEALQEYIERKQQKQQNRRVLNAFSESLGEFDDLYRELAK